MSETKVPFDEVGEQFIDYYATVRGHVREQVTRANLEPYLPESLDARIVDIGGGDGRDAEWLASLGYTDVTVYDPSSTMLDGSTHRNTIKGTEKDALEQLGEASCDLVLSHGVLMYQTEDIDGHLSRLARLLKPGRTLSLLTRGYQSSVERLEATGDSKSLQQLNETGIYVNNLGEQTTPLTPSDIERLFSENNLETTAWLGVRLATDDDSRPVASLSRRELSGIINEEKLLAGNARIKHRGQMLHFLGIKI